MYVLMQHMLSWYWTNVALPDNVHDARLVTTFRVGPTYYIDSFSMCVGPIPPNIRPPRHYNPVRPSLLPLTTSKSIISVLHKTLSEHRCLGSPDWFCGCTWPRRLVCMIEVLRHQKVSSVCRGEQGRCLVLGFLCVYHVEIWHAVTAWSFVFKLIKYA